MAVAPPVSATSIVEGIMKPKRVRKAILKLHNSDKELISLITLDKGTIIEAIQPTIATVSSISPNIDAIKVKTSKQRSKTGSKTAIIEQNDPNIVHKGNILEITAPINGTKEIRSLKIHLQTSFWSRQRIVELIILKMVYSLLPKRRSGDPLDPLIK